jgi:hypothetical protein
MMKKFKKEGTDLFLDGYNSVLGMSLIEVLGRKITDVNSSLILKV